MAGETKQLPFGAPEVLDGIGGALDMIAPFVPVGPWQIALRGIGAASRLVGDLVRGGHDPVQAITEMRSAMPDYRAAKLRLEKLIDTKARRP